MKEPVGVADFAVGVVAALGSSVVELGPDRGHHHEYECCIHAAMEHFDIKYPVGFNERGLKNRRSEK